MHISSVNHHDVTAHTANAAQRHEKLSAKPPDQHKDAAIISERAKDMAAKLSGRTAAEEMKESPVVEAGEEQMNSLK